MNRFQKVILYGTVLNVAILLLFPPYDVMAFGRSAPMFDAFYPMFSAPANRVINGDLLYIFIFGVLVNTAAAWLLLAAPKHSPGVPRFDPQSVVVTFAIFNLVLVMLFPPMEAFPFAQRITVGTFDGFYFAFGDKARRAIFVPLLYMEALFVLTNACAYWLAMSIAGRGQTLAADFGPMTMLAQSDYLRERAADKLLGEAASASSLSARGPDRRKGVMPGYKGPERRNRGERRRPKS